MLLITSESYRFRKNRCDYRTKSRNIYADLKVGVNIFGSQAWTGKGLQNRRDYRSLKGSVDVTRSQAFSESDLQATKIYAGVKPRVEVSLLSASSRRTTAASKQLLKWKIAQRYFLELNHASVKAYSERNISGNLKVSGNVLHQLHALHHET